MEGTSPRVPGNRCMMVMRCVVHDGSNSNTDHHDCLFQQIRYQRRKKARAGPQSKLDASDTDWYEPTTATSGDDLTIMTLDSNTHDSETSKPTASNSESPSGVDIFNNSIQTPVSDSTVRESPHPKRQQREIAGQQPKRKSRTQNPVYRHNDRDMRNPRSQRPNNNLNDDLRDRDDGVPDRPYPRDSERKSRYAGDSSARRPYPRYSGYASDDSVGLARPQKALRNPWRSSRRRYSGRLGLQRANRGLDSSDDPKSGMSEGGKYYSRKFGDRAYAHRYADNAEDRRGRQRYEPSFRGHGYMGDSS